MDLEIVKVKMNGISGFITEKHKFKKTYNTCFEILVI